MMTLTHARETERAGLKTYHDAIHLWTEECLQFIDLTDEIIALVRRSGIRNGVVNVQTKHTTTAVVINENEPLLLDDMRKTLERLAPEAGDYRHNDFEIRTVNMAPGEHPNGHSHCKAMFLKTSETLNIVDGAIQLGRWQRVFLIELDCPRERTVSVMVMGDELW
jgi:secondary thiamine-phosphate synthase enzyme